MPTWTTGAWSRVRRIAQAWLWRCDEVRIAQVGVRVDLQHAEALVPRGGGRDDGRRDRMFAAERHQKLSPVEDIARDPLQGAHRGFERR